MSDVLPNRRSVRLPAFDYASYGAYFITIVTAERQCTLGDVRDSTVELSPLGQTVHDEWLQNTVRREAVELDEFAVMPNHVHGIIWLNNAGIDTHTGALRRAPTGDEPFVRLYGPPQAGSLSTIINYFKGAVTRRAAAELGIKRVWQRGFYEHVIRSDKALAQIRQYIIDNPAAWAEDEENPANRGTQ